MRFWENAFCEKLARQFFAASDESMRFETRLDFIQCAFVARKVKFDVARVHRLSV